jgi:hypothetical protein
MSLIRRFLKFEFLFCIIISIILVLLGFYSLPEFDDVFLKKTGLLPFINFRPGYPPLGKFPYYSLFVVFSQTSAYSVSVYFLNMLSFFLLGIALYFCISKVNQKKALLLSLLVLAMPSVICFSLCVSHADALAMTLAIGALYFLDNPLLCGTLCGLGALAKFYPAILLLPILIYYRGTKKRLILIFSFVLTVLLLSLPFLLQDPLMYASVALSNNSRGPSESIFSIIDGYFGHTGFLHPTFDAAIYSWQFTAIYEPSPFDHFRYQWSIPVLPDISIGLQIFSMVIISWVARRTKDHREAIMLISLSMFSYFALSTFYNPIIEIALVCWLMLATLNWSRHAQLSVLAAFEAVNIFHTIIWFTPVFISIGVMLPLSVAVILRTILYIAVFLNFAKRRTI